VSRFLLVEDDELVGTMVAMNLRSRTDEVAWIRNGSEALEVALESTFDLILLDISLPGIDGVEILRSLRQRGLGTPILMLTARSDTKSKVAALGLGADDYLAKPFDVAEMIARVRALLRRARADRALPADRVLQFGTYVVNLETREASTNEGNVVLNEKEAAILEKLMKRSPLPVSRTEILEEVWGMDSFPTERTVDNFLLHLRKLFEPDPASPRHILTVRGTGYRFQQ
jgi:two-component system, OmpR family, alkaline phosphatase synthesis response regulator PhoP